MPGTISASTAARSAPGTACIVMSASSWPLPSSSTSLRRAARHDRRYLLPFDLPSSRRNGTAATFDDGAIPSVGGFARPCKAGRRPDLVYWFAKQGSYPISVRDLSRMDNLLRDRSWRRPTVLEPDSKMHLARLRSTPSVESMPQPATGAREVQ